MVGSGRLENVSSVRGGNLSGYLFLEMEVGSLLIPDSKGGGHGIHGLDSVHNPGGYSSRKVGDEGGGVLDFIVLCSYNIQLECTDILLELFPRVNASGGQPSHGFLGGVGVYKHCFKISLELGKCSERLSGQSLLVADFCPCGSGSFLHIGEGEGDFSIIVMVEGMIDQEVESDRVQPGLGSFSLSIIFFRASDT